MRLLRFTASWCAPCKVAGPLVDSMAARAGIPVEVIDVDRSKELVDAHAVRSVPAVVLLGAGGQTVYTGSGVECLPALRTALDSL